MKHFLIAFLFLLNTCAPAYAQSAGRVISADAVDGIHAPANLIRNGNFTRNKDAWAGYSGSGAIPTTSSGGVAGSDPAISRVTDTAFNSSNTAGAIVKTAANKQGSGVYYGFVVPSKYQGRTVSISFDYRLASGTFVNGNPSDLTSAGDSSLTVWIKDASNSQITQPSNYRILNASTTSVGKFKATFQFSGVAYDMALLFHQARSETTAFDFRISNVVISEEIAPTGAVITDWVSYTPAYSASMGTVTNNFLRYRRVGDSLEVQGNFTTGTITAATATISLPSGLSIDTSKMSTTQNQIVGYGDVNNATGGASKNFVLLYNQGVSTTNIYFSQDLPSPAVSPLVAQNATQMLYNTTITSLWFKVPIQGWSSNVQLSSDAGNSNIVFSGSKSATQAITAAVTDITFTTVKDSSGAWSGSTYTVPSPGDYSVSGSLTDNGTTAQIIYVYLNGAISRTLGFMSAGNAMCGNAILPNLKAGDVISLRSSATTTISANAGQNLSIFKISNPQTIAANDLVAASYKSTAGGSIGTSYTLQSFATKLQDTTGSWNGNTFTAPIQGLFRITSNVRTPNLTLGATQSFDVAVYKNGSIYILLNSVLGNGGTNNWYMSGGSIEVPLLAGETLQIYAKASVATTQNTDANSNFVSIVKVGN